MAEKEIVPYKSQFIYNTADNKAVVVKVDFKPKESGAVLDLDLSEEVLAGDLQIIIDSMAKNLKYKMDYDILNNNGKAVLNITASGKKVNYREGYSYS